MDLIIRNAKLREKEELQDIGIEKGKIKAVEKRISGTAEKEIDAKADSPRRPSLTHISTRTSPFLETRSTH